MCRLCYLCSSYFDKAVGTEGLRLRHPLSSISCDPNHQNWEQRGHLDQPLPQLSALAWSSESSPRHGGCSLSSGGSSAFLRSERPGLALTGDFLLQQHFPSCSVGKMEHFINELLWKKLFKLLCRGSCGEGEAPARRAGLGGILVLGRLLDWMVPGVPSKAYLAAP